jgi:hypothetical protein
VLDTRTVTVVFPVKTGVCGILLLEPQAVLKATTSATVDANSTLETQERHSFESSDEVDLDFINPASHLNF